MSVTFVIGRAGSGKTHRCLASIVDALKKDPLGPPIFWLLPRQATFSAERELTCNSGLEGFCRARVLSFEQLGHEIIAECGGASIPELTTIGRRMILGLLLRRKESQLKFFKNVARQPGLAAKLDATFGEFERAGKNAADLNLLLNELATGAPGEEENIALLDKVHDLHVIYTAYADYLGQDRLDQHQRLLHVLRCLGDSKLFRRATIYVDGFHEFTEYERRVLARLGKVCQRVEIALLMDPASKLLRESDLFPEETSLFHPIEIAYRRLRLVFREENVPVDEPTVVLSHFHRFVPASLQRVEQAAFADPQTRTPTPSDGVELVEAPTRRAEVDAAARRIKAFLRDGYRLRDIGVLVRDLSSYQELINVSFREHDIRYFIDRRRETAHHPVLQFIRSVLILADQNWPHEWVMTLLKTGLAGIAPDEADALENYVLRHRIRGEQWESSDPWRFEATGLLSHEEDKGTPAAPTDRIDANRRFLVSGLRPFREKTRRGAPVREIVAALFEVIAHFKVRETIAGWITEAKQQEQFEWMEEHRQVWSETVGLFDQMVELLGDERARPEGFQEILEAGLQQFDLGLTPPTVDEVLVGQVDRTRTPEVKAVLVLGLGEGVFPSVPCEDSVLCDADRREFHRQNLDVSPATDRLLLNENLLGYIAFTRASHVLYASRPLSDGKGKALGPSIFWRRLTKLFPDLPPTRLLREERDVPSLIATPRQLVTSLMRWVRKPIGDAEDTTATPWPALYQWLAAHPRDGSAIDTMRFGAWSALSHFNAAALSPEIAAQLFASPLRAGVAQIETFAACPFKHFVRYGLDLHPREGGDVSALDLGNVFHQVLESIVADLLKRRLTWADLNDKQRQKKIRAAADRIAHDLRGEVMLSTARNRYLMQRIERTLNQVVVTQQIAAGRGRFKPAFTKVRFGENAELPEFALSTPKRREVRLSGKIDRVDMADGGSDFVIIDYRLGENRLQLGDAYHGISLQLLVYLLVLEANGEALAGRKLTPAAAFYVRMLRWMGNVAHPSEALSPDDPRFHLSAKPRGILVERIARDLDTSLVEGASEVIQATIKKDGGFGSKRNSDLASGDEFAALLAHVRGRIAELADQILDGEIGISPHMIGQATPCPRCEYQGICRFENTTGRYHHLPQMNREEVFMAVLEQAKKEAPDVG